MNTKNHGILTSEKPILGFRPADLLGILFMIIPFVISIIWEGKIRTPLTFITHKYKTTDILPCAITMLLAVVFYAALIVRFDFFKADNLAQALISSLRTFLDCWVLASLLSIVLPSTQNKSLTVIQLIKEPQIMLLFFAVILTWLGMRTVAGYSWIFFILTAGRNAFAKNNAMDVVGAVFILTTTISLFLQVKDLSLAKDFFQDFKAETRGFSRQVNNNINYAAFDAKKRVYVVSESVRKSIPGAGVANLSATQPEITRDTETSRGVRIDLKALDINGDGVVDEKDFELLRKQ